VSLERVETTSRPWAPSLADVLTDRTITSVFQPVVEIDSGAVVAYEALARGPKGPLGSPAALFAAAREEGLLIELDEACREAAFTSAIRQGVIPPLTLFVNVEAEVLDTAAEQVLPQVAAAAPADLRVVLEITERSLFARPAELLRTVERVRDLGWGIALDDVGAEAASLALMPLLRPDIVKLDLSLVQQRPGPAVAEIMSAVNAYAEESGALLLAEGIETAEHLAAARALGASLGQGWLFGRPARQLLVARPAAPLALPASRPAGGLVPESPFACLRPGTPLRRAPKRLLVEMSKHLEREAMQLGPACIVGSTFQDARHLTPDTRRRYEQIAGRVGLVAAVGRDFAEEPMPGVRGADLDECDAVLGEWDVVVLSPHFAAALLARDRGHVGSDSEREFDYALTFDRQTVVRAAHALLTRLSAQSAATRTRVPVASSR
jgi:EAL domain-containing protein (putative c-di-GMP-specific phosphodiesterase class I)